MNKITSINGTLLASLNELNEHTENGTVHVTEDDRTAWNTQATVKAKGILIATQEDLDEHTGNKTIHVAEEERTAWNAKVDASALSTKADTSVFDAHKNDAVAHITGKERETWNGKQDRLTDEEGNMTLAGGLATNRTINANGGINIPTAPVTASNAVRLGDMMTPALIPPLGSRDKMFPVKIVQGNCVSACGVIVNNSQAPFILSTQRVGGPGDDNYAAWIPMTFVLELNPLANVYSDIKIEGAEALKDYGVRANFGFMRHAHNSTIPESHWGGFNNNDYVVPVMRAVEMQYSEASVPSVWPGSAGSDYLARVGFQQARTYEGGTSISDLNKSKLNYFLFACYDRRNIVRFIVYYNRNQVDERHYYLFTQDRSGVISLIGWAGGVYSFINPILVLANSGKSGCQGCWSKSEDVFNLTSVCRASWPGGTVPATDVTWPIAQSLFLPSANGEMVTVQITANNKSCSMVSCPDWIIWEDGAEGSGQVLLTVAANETGAERDGLVNMVLFNGITYTVLIRQTA